MDEAATPRSEAATASQISDLQDTRRSADGDKKLLAPKALKKLPAENPFKLPPENELFLLRDKEKQEKKNQRELMKHTRIEDKAVVKPRINLKEVAEIEPDPIEERQSDIVAAVKRDPQFVLAVTRDRRVEREVLSDYIAKKREMFLVQYALNVKRDEMRKLEEIAQAEEKKLELAEQALEEDAAMFDEYLKENDRNSVEAIKAAEAETKAKLEKIGEIKKLNAQIVAIKSEISKHEDTLKEYKMYKSFLDRLTPEAYQQQKTVAKAKRQEEKKKQKEKEKEAAATKAKVAVQKQKSNVASKMVSIMPLAVVAGQTSRQVMPTWQLLTAAVVSSNQQKKRQSIKMQPTDEDSRRMSKSPTMADDRSVTSDKEGEDTAESSDDEDLEMYFTSPQQVLDIFAELEEQNLSLIQNSQETEEALEEMRQQIKQTKQKMQKETEVLKEQIEKIKAAIAKEEDRAKELELKTKMFSYGQFDAEQQDALLHQLNQKVTEVYRNCIGGEANIKGDTLQMLAAVEHRLEELCDTIENMPKDKVEAAERAKEKQRRLEMREQKLQQQKLHQEERIRKALERAKQPPKKQHGRRPVYRSEPPKMKARDTGEDDRAAREAEELAYYLQP